MHTKRKFLTIFLTLLFCLMLPFALASCDNGGGDDTPPPTKAEQIETHAKTHVTARCYLQYSVAPTKFYKVNQRLTDYDSTTETYYVWGIFEVPLGNNRYQSGSYSITVIYDLVENEVYDSSGLEIVF
ncbi:MAG: hypothetical protein IKC37_02950 [Clostridia bacterium]|nr:hypothetical protein [Clostridia bacterium]